MPKVLKNLTVTEVSILTGDKLPANGESVIIKDADSFEIIAKADSCIDGLVYCTVMKANTPDSDGDESNPETIRKAAHDFMKHSRTIDENHNHSALDGVHVVQSYIDDKGDWKAVFDVSDNSIMLEKAKKGEITGVSIYGKAQKVEKAGKELSTKNAGKLKQAWDILSSFFSGEQQEQPENNELAKSTKEESLMTKDELKAMLAEIATETKATDEQVAKEKKVADLEASVKTLTETVEKQAKTIEEIAKERKTDNGADGGEITIQTILKCKDPIQRQEMYEKLNKK